MLNAKFGFKSQNETVLDCKYDMFKVTQTALHTLKTKMKLYRFQVS